MMQNNDSQTKRWNAEFEAKQAKRAIIVFRIFFLHSCSDRIWRYFCQKKKVKKDGSFPPYSSYYL
jgi:hypothetical protein